MAFSVSHTELTPIDLFCALIWGQYPETYQIQPLTILAKKMCLYAAHKFTLCGCIWDEWSNVCKDPRWCPGRRLIILANYKRLCKECSAKEHMQPKRKKPVRLLENVEPVGPQDPSAEDPAEEYPHTETSMPRLCDPVEAGQDRRKRGTGPSTRRK